MPVYIRIPLGLIIMFVGFMIVKRTDRVLEWFGAVDFAEQKFGPGGSRFFYKLIGIATVFLGIAIVSNFINDILGSTANLLTHN